MYEIMIGSGFEFVKITVFGRTYPGLAGSDDGQWLNAEVSAVIGRLKCRYDACLRIDEFEPFLKGLREVQKNTKAKAIYEALEEWLYIKIESLDQLGHLRGFVLAKDRPGTDNQLSGSIMLDQTF